MAANPRAATKAGIVAPASPVLGSDAEEVRVCVLVLVLVPLCAWAGLVVWEVSACAAGCGSGVGVGSESGSGSGVLAARAAKVAGSSSTMDSGFESTEWSL